MAGDSLDDWIDALRVPSRRRRAIVRELRTHLEEARRELVEAGWNPEEAAQVSLVRLGDPNVLLEEFSRVHYPARARRIFLAACLATTLLAGAYGGGALTSAASIGHQHAPATRQDQPQSPCGSAVHCPNKPRTSAPRTGHS